MTECTNHRPWDTKTPSHKISHDEYYEKRGTTDKTKHIGLCFVQIAQNQIAQNLGNLILPKFCDVCPNHDFLAHYG